MAEEEGAVLQGHCADLKRMYCTAGGQGKTCCFLLRTLGAGRDFVSLLGTLVPGDVGEASTISPALGTHTALSPLTPCTPSSFHAYRAKG